MQVRSGCGAEFIQNKSSKAHQNIFSWDFPRAVLCLRLPGQGVDIRFLVWELRSHMLHGAVKKKKKTKTTPFLLKTIWHASLGFPCGSAGKESPCNEGDLDLISRQERSPGEEEGYPFQYSGLENSMNCDNHGVATNRTRMCDFHFHFSGRRQDIGRGNCYS